MLPPASRASPAGSFTVRRNSPVPRCAAAGSTTSASNERSFRGTATIVAASGHNGGMNVYQERREELEKHEFMMGKSRGQLAVTLDVLTDALVLVGQHGVYCQSARTPGKPAMDIQIIVKSISDAKELIAGVMAELKLRDSA